MLFLAYIQYYFRQKNVRRNMVLVIKNELRELMGNVSPKTLSQRLKGLEELHFVERRAFAEIPPRVEYHLLEKGRALGDVIEALEQFAEQNLSTPKNSSTDTSQLHL